ncbi:MAG: hypothetical protein WCQ00_03925 [bacterium]
MTTKVTNTINIIDRISVTLFWSFLAVFMFLMGTYGYMVNKTVWNAFDKDQSDEQIVALNSKLGDLEFQYMSLSNNISIEKAYELGFQNASANTIFASREFVSKNVAMK